MVRTIRAKSSPGHPHARRARYSAISALVSGLAILFWSFQSGP
jgi:hypothetical protein